MSKKLLSRTVIEGGRTRGSKERRRASHRQVRAHMKRELHKVNCYTDYADQADLYVSRLERVYKLFDDKLAPCYRWLNSKVGQPWDEVHSLLRRTFDSRSLAGQHILHDHMLQSVATAPHEIEQMRGYSRWSFFVDDDGLLQNKWTRSWRSPWAKERQILSHEEMFKWAGNRKAMVYPSVIHWAYPAHMNWRDCHGHDTDGYLKGDYSYRPCYKPHRIIKRKAFNAGTFFEVKVLQHEYALSWKQGSVFFDSDMETWNKLTNAQREMLMHPAQLE